jgi:hypothetical protein
VVYNKTDTKRFKAICKFILAIIETTHEVDTFPLRHKLLKVYRENATEEIIDLHTDGRSDRRTEFRLIKIGSGKSVSPFPVQRGDVCWTAAPQNSNHTRNSGEKDLGRAPGALWLPSKIIAAEHRHCSSGEREDRRRRKVPCRSLECDMYVRVSIYLWCVWCENRCFSVCGGLRAACFIFYVRRSRTFGSLYFAFGPRAAIKAAFYIHSTLLVKRCWCTFICAQRGVAHTCRIVCLEFREHLGR